MLLLLESFGLVLFGYCRLKLTNFEFFEGDGGRGLMAKEGVKGGRLNYDYVLRNF